MPRQTAPPPSDEFDIHLTKPFSGHPKHTIEIIGEPNRPATVRVTHYNSETKFSEKTGEVPKDDVHELLELVSTMTGLPSNQSKDIYGHDTKVQFNTFKGQWSNADVDPSADSIHELAREQKDDFKRVSDSIEALSRTFAKHNA
ncbi:hypothetical protein K470DRAFT_243992, partial [Piedraia hortae CBS 480.64]